MPAIRRDVGYPGRRRHRATLLVWPGHPGNVGVAVRRLARQACASRTQVEEI